MALVSPSSQLSILAEERAALLELWELRRQQYEQCMDLQLFYRDTEQVDNWMSKQEVSVFFLARLQRRRLAYFGQEVTSTAVVNRVKRARWVALLAFLPPPGLEAPGTGPGLRDECAGEGLVLPEEYFWVVLVWNLALHPIIRLVLSESKGRQAFWKRSWKFNSCRISLLLFVFWPLYPLLARSLQGRKGIPPSTLCPFSRPSC